jgi:hypothetical protein
MDAMGVDAPPSADVPQRGGFLGFLGTIPGILTALAGVITALASLFYIFHLASGSPEPLPGVAQPPPETPVDANSVAIRADSAPAADDAMLSDPATVLYTDCANGFVDSCDTLFYLLVDDCQYGDPYSCDVLYWISPVGSDYETYGATCGGLVDWQYGRCSEL